MAPVSRSCPNQHASKELVLESVVEEVRVTVEDLISQVEKRLEKGWSQKEEGQNERAKVRRQRLRNPRMWFKSLSSQVCSMFFRSSHKGPSSLKRINNVPPIYLIKDFLREQDIRFFMQVCNDAGGLKGSLNSYTENESGQKIFSTYRTSTFTFLRKFGSQKVMRTEVKAAELVGLDSQNVEPIQIVHYKDGQHFGVHHDCGGLTDDGTLITSDIGQEVRIVTFFVYLNTLEEGQGGCTVFPKLDLRIRPEKGTALLFCNITSEGKLDERVIHEAQPVKQGHTKYGMNIWISNVSQAAFTNSESGIVLHEQNRDGGMKKHHKRERETISRQRACSSLSSMQSRKKQKIDCPSKNCKACFYFHQSVALL